MGKQTVKRIFCLILILPLFSTTAVYAETANTGTPLRFGTSQKVYGLLAYYTIETDDVQSVSVQFRDGLGFAQSNVVNGKLKIAIASADPLNLSGDVALVTAQLTGGATVSPELTLYSLSFNNEPATENLTQMAANASQSGTTVTASASIHNDFTGKSYQIIAAVYSQKNQMLKVMSKTLSFDEKDESIDFVFTNCENAAKVKVFLLSTEHTPILPTAEATVAGS